MSGRMILDTTVFDTDEITAHRHLARLYIDSHTRRFQRASTLEHPVEVVTQYRQIGDFATGVITIGDCLQQTTTTMSCQPVHSRSIGRLQRRSSAQFPDGFVGHTVAQNNDIFHRPFVFYLFSYICNSLPLSFHSPYILFRQVNRINLSKRRRYKSELFLFICIFPIFTRL